MGAQEMGLTWKEEHLDFVLVPSGLLIMLGYHLFHVHRCINLPETTVIGYENHNRRAWVARFLQLEAKERSQAITVIGSNLSAATSLASISLALSSLIGAWIGSAYHNENITSRIYGNTSATIVYLKYIALLSCFMVAFACFVQTARCFVHANFLISTPNCEMPVRNVESAVISGSNFWVAGLRSLYFATNLLLWIFGPIPMFVCSVITVLLLHYLDKNTTPLPQYNPPLRYDYSKKISREMKASPGTTEHHQESQDHCNDT
ncbi:hypothetical protein Salat_0250300 [Sesamum alatum]|uniref:Uncharacterized protein n=1 Tax=Sesamum alatum TaxID=300844 RepID=A0AAE1YZ50_9LAMI|nr:hypothetical protein Salat_0250300 [Sesamum alatum]